MEIRPEIKEMLHAKRFQRFLNLTKDVPRIKGECAWCTRPGRKGLKYCSDECSDDANIRASSTDVAIQVKNRDHGICAMCGKLPERTYPKSWEALHKLPVHKGGGVCGLDNYQTLCITCHVKAGRVNYGRVI